MAFRALTYQLRLAYDGRGFHGWARQPDQRTLEGLIRPVLTASAPGFRAMQVAGRTDRGVSALAQVVSFRCDAALNIQSMLDRINQLAPGEVWALDLRTMPRSFHARAEARARHYRYLLPCPSPAVQLRIARMLDRLVGKRDFYAFARDTPPGQTSLCRLLRAKCQAGHLDGWPCLRIELSADRFLRRQVRVLVATAVREAEADAPEDRLLEILATRDRRATAPAAPPEPLLFVGADYGNEP